MSGPCGCLFYVNAPETHDLVLGIESMMGIDSARLLVALMVDDEIQGISDKEPLLGTETFVEFVAQHNWQDPLAMFWLADTSATAFDAESKGRTERYRSRMIRQAGAAS
jgi:hypothetical protein